MNPNQRCLRTVIAEPPGGMRIIYTLEDGRYLGELQVRICNQEALKAVADDFQSYVREATGQIQLANGATAAALKTQ